MVRRYGREIMESRYVVKGVAVRYVNVCYVVKGLKIGDI